MAGCAHCGGCCASCGATCGEFGGSFSAVGYAGGVLGGGGLAPGLDGDDGIHDDDGDRVNGGYGYFGGVQFHPWFGSRKKSEDASTTTVDSRALADPNHPGHREAVTAISHVDPDQHSRLMDWLRRELGQAHP